jgi:class 3 adenylate cyclase/tetratricopeptide (TPR) repeat protein
MSCPKCGHEPADDIETCPNCGVKALVCASCGAGALHGANFCSACGNRLRPSGEQRIPERLQLMERVFGSRAAVEGERKQITVLFADLRGSLSIIDGIDAEEVQALLDAVLAAMAEAVHRYEGAVNQTMGDGIMALFGAPLAHEDHALRAACAALAMQDAVRRLQDASWKARGLQPQIRVGLHSGEVAVRAVRSDLNMEYRAVGTTTHIAARMEQLATPGSVYLTADTLRLGRGLMRTRPLGPQQVKGVQAPIEVFELTGISIRTRFQAIALRGLSPLVGREQPLRALTHSLERAADGERSVAVLCGEPGIGKSRLCHEVLRHASDGFRVLEAAAPSYGRATPHVFLASMVRGLFGVDDDDSVEQLKAKAQAALAELDGALSPHIHAVLELLDVPSRDREWARLDPVQKRRNLEKLLRALLEAWCARGPAVLLFEDLHWCDQESLSFIAGLVESPPGTQTLMLITHRPELDPPWSRSSNVVSYRIDRLDATESEGLLRNLLGSHAGLAGLRSLLVVRTDGNPFFIEESARAVMDSSGLRDLMRDGVEAALRAKLPDMPATIDALIGARVDRLSEPLLELLQAAAVLGDDSPRDVLREVASVPKSEFDARFEDLVRAELLYGTGTLKGDAAGSQGGFRFKHALIQEVVYKRLVRARRRALHGRAVDVIRAQYPERVAEHVERLAEHAHQAERWFECAEYHTLACVRAASRSSNDQAIVHLEGGLEALAHVPPGPERDRAAIDIRLTALAPLQPTGAHHRVVQLLREAEQHARSLNDGRRLAKISSQLSAGLWATAQYDQAMNAAQEALALAAALPGDQFALESSARYNAAMTHHARGEFDAALAILRELKQRFSGDAAHRRLGWAGYPSVFVRTFIISVNAMIGGFAEIESAYAEGRALAEELDHPFSRTMILEQYGMYLVVAGEAARAVAVLREALAVCEKDEVRTMYTPIASHLGVALLDLGELDAGRKLLEDAAAGATDLAGHYAIDYLTIGLADARLRTGDLASARETAERAVRDTEACGEVGFHVRALLQYAAVLSALDGQRAQATSTYALAIDRARQLGMRPWVALAQHGLARLHELEGRSDAAADLLESALQYWRESNARARVEQLTAESARLRSGRQSAARVPG